jgi:methyltransferase
MSSKRKRDPDAEVSFECLVTPDFEELARRFPDFGYAYKDVLQQQHLHGGHFSSFVTQEFSIALTKALLHVHWKLALTHLPSHHLCPPVPNRYFMVQWMLQQVLPSTRQYFYTQRQFTYQGMDIGTGATAIYPLIIAAVSNQRGRPYNIHATDIDAESVALARENVRSNHMESQILVHLVPNTSQPECGPLSTSLACLPLEREMRTLDFCLTNPPFFDDSTTTTTENRLGDGRARTSMTVSEGSYPDGEVAFCLGIFLDGLVLVKEQQQAMHNPHSSPPPPIWSACMCGKKSSWLQLKAILTHTLGPGHVLATEFGPGHLTRWFLAWTFEQPSEDSPLAVSGNELLFTVNVVLDDQGMQRTQGLIEEVEKRIHAYFDEYPQTRFSISRAAVQLGRRLLVRQEESSLQEMWLSDEASITSQLPLNVKGVLSGMDATIKRHFLPPGGHFLIVIDISNQEAAQPGLVPVKVSFYAHSIVGKQLIERVRNKLVSELCRTSRRWRRRLNHASTDGVTY